MDVIRTYLEMRAPTELRPAAAVGPALDIRPLAHCTVAEYRTLYRAVGERWHWRDRLPWSDSELAAYLAQPAIRLWALRDGEETAGYFELAAHEDGSVEIVLFGLTAPFIGRGLGKRMLTRAVEEAWALGAQRVWLHTCTLDSPSALPNYLARGFTPYREERYTVALPDEGAGAT